MIPTDSAAIRLSRIAITARPDLEFTKFNTINNVINNITYKSIETITQTTKLNSLENLEESIKELINAKTVYIFGVGGSALVSLDLQQKLIRINKPTVTSLDSHTQQMSSLNITKDDVAIGISYSGRSKEIIKSIQNGIHS